MALLAAACDPQAQPAQGIARAEVAGASQAFSRERESCAATADCEPPLRCVEAACRRPTTSRLGDYYWASAELHLGKGQTEAAIEAFQNAVAQFEEAKLDPPPALLCSYGAALRRMKGDAKASERAARLLHRCLLAAAPGSSDYRTALHELAELETVGLDPGLVARDAPADSYLTRPAKKPPLSKVQLDVAQTAPHKSPVYAAWVQELSSDATRGRLYHCYGEYWAATQKTKMTVVLPLRYKARFDEEEEVYVGGALELDPAPDATGPEAAASECVRAALAGQAAEVGKAGKGGSFAATVSITLRAGS
jgi:hypothetical protein